jgi:hypothetical protein
VFCSDYSKRFLIFVALLQVQRRLLSCSARTSARFFLLKLARLMNNSKSVFKFRSYDVPSPTWWRVRLTLFNAAAASSQNSLSFCKQADW